MTARNSFGEVSVSWLAKVLLVLITYHLSLITSLAQEGGGKHRFSPEKFDAELRQFITKEAKLTEQEAAKFFPVYKEMQTKQRAVFGRQRALVMTNPEGEKACLEAIRQRDENDLEMKRIQQTYHEKFLEMLPASKVYAILRAEDMFHRRMLKRSAPTPSHKDQGKAPNWKRNE